MPAHRVPRIQLLCAYEPCSKPFEAMPAEAKRGGIRYHSPTCRRLARQQPRVFPQMLTCAYTPCGQTFAVLPWQATIWKYCSPACYQAARLIQSHDAFAARFWSKVDKTPGYGPRGLCWLWRGATHANGYGNFRATPYKEGNISAHIVSWFLKTGAWPPEGLFVLHGCDVRACVNNEDCLFLGTHTDNMQDMIAKGRGVMQTNPAPVIARLKQWNEQHPTRPQTSGDRNGMRLHPASVLRGDKSPRMKLTEAQLQECIALYATGQWTFKQLGTRYGVTGRAISYRILHQQKPLSD